MADEKQQEFDFVEQEDGTFSGSQEEIAPTELNPSDKLLEAISKVGASVEEMNKLVDMLGKSPAFELIEESKQLVDDVERILKSLE